MGTTGGEEEKSFFYTLIFNSDNFMQHKEQYGGSFLGHPGWNGEESILRSSEVFAINSASHNKQGAWDFLDFLLSKEMQDRIDWQFPVRIDSFEKYLSMTTASAKGVGQEFAYYISTVPPMTQEDIAMLQRLIDSAVFRDSTTTAYENPVREILREETQMYFAGDATLDETINKIQNRVQIYLNEQ